MSTVKIIPRTGRCRDCKAYSEHKGMWNVDPIERKCALGYQMTHDFGIPSRPKEPCPRPLTDDQFYEARELTKAARLAAAI